MSVTKVLRTAYMTSKGVEFPTQDEAEAHEMKTKILELLEREGVGSGGEWSQMMFLQFLLAERTTLGPLLIPELLSTGDY